MKTKNIMLCALLLAPLGCDNNNTNPGIDSGGTIDMAQQGSTDMAMGPPAAPAIGAIQIDRMGRPGINTAITDPFWDDGVQTVDQHHAKQDAYNAASNPAMWASTMIGGKDELTLFKAILAAYDGLNTGLAAAPNTCGDQLAFGGPLGAAYTTLATVLVDDELYMDASHTTCAAYLGVEANALGAVNTDCGGRALSYNTIDITYNVLIGTAQGTVTNGVTADGDGTPSDTTFPYLGAPN